MSPDLKLFVSQDIEGFGQLVVIVGADDSVAECFLVHLPIDSDEVRCVTGRSYRLDEAEDTADTVDTDLVAQPLLSLIQNDPWVKEHLPNIKLTVP